MSFLSEAGAYKVTRSVKILRGTKALFKIEVTYDEFLNQGSIVISHLAHTRKLIWLKRQVDDGSGNQY